MNAAATGIFAKGNSFLTFLVFFFVYIVLLLISANIYQIWMSFVLNQCYSTWLATMKHFDFSLKYIFNQKSEIRNQRFYIYFQIEFSLWAPCDKFQVVDLIQHISQDFIFSNKTIPRKNTVKTDCMSNKN